MCSLYAHFIQERHENKFTHNSLKQNPLETCNKYCLQYNLLPLLVNKTDLASTESAFASQPGRLCGALFHIRVTLRWEFNCVVLVSAKNRWSNEKAIISPLFSRQTLSLRLCISNAWLMNFDDMCPSRGAVPDWDSSTTFPIGRCSWL